MDQAGKSFTSDSTDARRWIGRIIMAVILGEAIWSVIVSVMNNVVVPWLGDLFGQSSGLPTSFTQRPYNYPDLFVSFIEFCIAGLVAASINYFFQRPGTRRVKQKTLAPTVPVPPVRVVPQTAPASLSQVPSPPAPAPAAIKLDPIPSPAPVPTVVIAPSPVVEPAPPPKSATIAPLSPTAPSSVVKPPPPAVKAQPSKPKKPKEVYYNIVGEPMPSDED